MFTVLVLQGERQQCCGKVCAGCPAGETASCALNLFITHSKFRVPQVTLTFSKGRLLKKSNINPELPCAVAGGRFVTVDGGRVLGWAAPSVR